MPIGIMQGRLLPPVGGRLQAFPGDLWSKEFELAASLGIDCIEWIYDLQSASENPVARDEGGPAISDIARRSGVTVRSLCADYFIDVPLVGTRTETSGALDHLAWLLERCAGVGMQRVIVPFVDASAIRSPAELKQAAKAVGRAADVARRQHVEIHLETSLEPDEYRSLLGRLPEDVVKVTYDSGNSASLGFAPAREFDAYGPRIGSVHVKDRVRGGGSVPLGTGDADLATVFAGLRRLRYSGDFILQVSRGEPGDEVAWAAHNVSFVAALWDASA